VENAPICDDFKKKSLERKSVEALLPVTWERKPRHHWAKAPNSVGWCLGGHIQTGQAGAQAAEVGARYDSAEEVLFKSTRGCEIN